MAGDRPGGAVSASFPSSSALPTLCAGLGSRSHRHFLKAAAWCPGPSPACRHGESPSPGAEAGEEGAQQVETGGRGSKSRDAKRVLGKEVGGHRNSRAGSPRDRSPGCGCDFRAAAGLSPAQPQLTTWEQAATEGAELPVG